jgi:uncharacterized protein YndB with AHSA1/START domain
MTINRPREEVFAYAADSENETLWQSGLVEFKGDRPGQPDVGDRARGTVKVAGRKVRFMSETTEMRPPERFAFRSVEAPFPFEVSYTFVDRGGSTEVRIDGSTE